ncbi:MULTISPECIES: FAD-binding oxidoreductase [Gordonia]|uniref:Delta(24)-sterol reductase n=1 Tax=Gordonia sihwensis NBRC 108236 TaxID=1223544 RepID=L7LLK6_9ACTN|nr:MULTISPECIES: FAD-binding oxidoreductase [Gordonia]AUH70117.1 FAD-binding oxidoreductase [Gordonia sp. YC-JH1]GAC62005.1 putative oxidoreductase [Gordonia sihwensis NBRC 108236]
MNASEYDDAAFARGKQKLLDSYRAIPDGATVRLAKKTSNLFRKRAETSAPGLDVSELHRVISVDPEEQTAQVAGMCTYEDLVDATLPYGLVPLVVPQLKTITLGGAVTGLGIESTSFRNGLPHESVLEMEILTGSGELIVATPDNEHRDLFFGFPNSYGTLGYSVRLKIRLEPVPPFVELRHVRVHSTRELQDLLDRVATDREYRGERVDYLDGVIFTSDEAYAVLGRQTDEPGPVSDYTDANIFYRSIQHDGAEPKRDRLTIRDYLWRWDTDWFWCSRAFGAQNPRIRRFWPAKYLRSSFYWKLIGYDQRWNIGDKLNAVKGLPPTERVVQDIEVPIERTADFVDWFLDEIPIEPIWLCPLKLAEPSPIAVAGDDETVQPWTLYPLERGKFYVNIGFWSGVPVTPGRPGHTNRIIEQKVSELGGHKSLYSESFYGPEEFDDLYGGEAYDDLKRRYDPRGRLLGLYEKAVKRA